MPSGPWFITMVRRGRGCLASAPVTIPFSLCSVVLPGPGAAFGAGHHGTGAAGERAGHLPLVAVLRCLLAYSLPGQECSVPGLQRASLNGGWVGSWSQPLHEEAGAPGVALRCFLQPPEDIRAAGSWVGLMALRTQPPCLPTSRAVGLWERGNPPLRGSQPSNLWNTCVSACGPAGSRLLQCLGNDALTPAHCVRLWLALIVLWVS